MVCLEPGAEAAPAAQLAARRWNAGGRPTNPAPFRHEDRVRSRESFERRTLFIHAINRSSYFGYDLFTTLGLTRDSREFDDPLLRTAEFDTMSFFARAIIGFSEHGRPL